MQTADTYPDKTGGAAYPSLSPRHTIAADGANFYQAKIPFEHTAQAAAGKNRSKSLTSALGWFRIGLGAAQLLVPRRIAHATGMAEHQTLLRVLGTREIASGVSILKQPASLAALYARVGGDAIAITVLSAIATSASSVPQRRRTTIAAAAIAGMTALDVWSSIRQRHQLAATAINFEKTLVIHRSFRECYRFWRNFENLPRFIRHLQQVRILSDTRSHWVIHTPTGIRAECDVDITYDQPNQMLVWNSVEGSEIDHAGQIRFESSPEENSTTVRIEFQYRPALGDTGLRIAEMFGTEFESEIEQDIERFRQLIETGEIAAADDTPSRHRSLLQRWWRK